MLSHAKRRCSSGGVVDLSIAIMRCVGVSISARVMDGGLLLFLGYLGIVIIEMATSMANT